MGNVRGRLIMVMHDRYHVPAHDHHLIKSLIPYSTGNALRLSYDQGSRRTLRQSGNNDSQARARDRGARGSQGEELHSPGPGRDGQAQETAEAVLVRGVRESPREVLRGGGCERAEEDPGEENGNGNGGGGHVRPEEVERPAGGSAPGEGRTDPGPEPGARRAHGAPARDEHSHERSSGASAHRAAEEKALVEIRSTIRSMDPLAFRQAAQEALDALPRQIRVAVRDVVIIIEPRP